MKHSFQKRLPGVIGLALMLSLSATLALAQNMRFRDAARHSQAAANVFTAIMGIRDQGIPKELLDKAEAIMVFPGVVKAAFGIGGQGGQDRPRPLPPLPTPPKSGSKLHAPPKRWRALCCLSHRRISTSLHSPRWLV